MKNYLLYCFLLLFSVLKAQSGGLVEIKKVRTALTEAFRRDDLLEAGLWMDSLARLETAEQAALIWDERWLLYLWSGAFGNLFEEAAAMNAEKKATLAFKNQPPPDSLYTILDADLFENRFSLFNSLQTSMLTEEEKAFTALLFDYLLRLNENATDWNDRLGVFEKKFPESRFLEFVRTIKTPVYKPNPVKGSCSILIGQAQPGGAIQQNIRSGFAFMADLGAWQNRWNYMAGLIITGQKLHRDLVNGQSVWPKGSSSNLVVGTLAVGYDILDKPGLRIYPTAGIGLCSFGPPDSEEYPAPEEYLDFQAFSWTLHGSINIDMKNPFVKNTSALKQNYYGLRFRIGYERPHFGKTLDALAGGWFFIGLGPSFWGW